MTTRTQISRGKSREKNPSPVRAATRVENVNKNVLRDPNILIKFSCFFKDEKHIKEKNSVLREQMGNVLFVTFLEIPR